MRKHVVPAAVTPAADEGKDVEALIRSLKANPPEGRAPC
jgi:hypothetical protein